MGNRTLAIIKPDAVENGYMGQIIDRIEQADFRILGAKFIHMTKTQAEGFYAVHQGKPFYEELTEFMSGNPCMVIALEKDKAVDAWRETIGATNKADAAEGTIRKDFAESIGRNAVHGSDSDENAVKEIGFFFSEAEIIANN